MKYIALVIAIIVLGILSHCLLRDSDISDIHKYHESRNERVVSVERALFSRGPYWVVNKNNRIYQVFTADGKEYWWRCGNLFSDDVEEVKK